MPSKIFPKQTNFAAGELDDSLIARSDLERYKNGLLQCFNFLPKQQGGVTRSPGTSYLSTLPGASRLIAFEIATSEWYILVLRDLQLDVWSADALVQTLVSPWPSAAVWEVDASQLRDMMVLAQEDYPPQLLTRSPAGVFSLTDLSVGPAPNLLTNIPLLDGVLRWQANYYSPKGTYLIPTTDNTFYYVVSATSGTQQTGASEPSWPTTIGGTVVNGGVTIRCEGPSSVARAWSAGAGWPRTVTFAENRLCFGGSKSYPTRRWLSKSADYFNFDPGIGMDDEAITDERLSDQLETVQWVAEQIRFISGTTSQEWVEQGSDPMTPANIDLRPQTDVGSERVTPAVVDGLIFHVARGGQQIHGILWNELAQKFETSSFSLLNSRALTSVTQLAKCKPVDPRDAPMLLCANASGDMGILFTRRNQDFLAWCRRGIQGSIESVASAGGQIYIVGAFGYGDGIFEPGTFEPGTFADSEASVSRFLLKWDPNVYVDAARTLTSVAETSTWSGLTHLAGWEVDATIDGVIERGLQVAMDGTLQTTNPGLKCVVGVPLPTPTIELLPPTISTTIGSADMKLKRIIRAEIESTAGVTVKRGKGWKRSPTTVITAEDPLPVTILAVTQEVIF